MTKRPHLLIMDKIRQKLKLQLEKKLGAQFGGNILDALKDKSIDCSVRNMMKEDKIVIMKQDGSQAYTNTVKKAAYGTDNTPAASGVKRQGNGKKVDVIEVPEKFEDEECMSPEIRSKTYLVRFILTFRKWLLKTLITLRTKLLTISEEHQSLIFDELRS